MSVFIQLFHGRKDPNEKLEDWGSQGPVLGPLDWVQMTYRCGFQCGVGDKQFDLTFVNDCAYYDGVYYGDIDIVTDDRRGIETKTAVPFDEAKAELPELERVRYKNDGLSSPTNVRPIEKYIQESDRPDFSRVAQETMEEHKRTGITEGVLAVELEKAWEAGRDTGISRASDAKRDEKPDDEPIPIKDVLMADGSLKNFEVKVVPSEKTVLETIEKKFSEAEVRAAEVFQAETPMLEQFSKEKGWDKLTGEELSRLRMPMKPRAFGILYTSEDLLSEEEKALLKEFKALTWEMIKRQRAKDGVTRDLISAAAQAEEEIPYDELEEHARKMAKGKKVER